MEIIICVLLNNLKRIYILYPIKKLYFNQKTNEIIIQKNKFMKFKIVKYIIKLIITISFF